MNAILIFVVLFYVYPLKFVFTLVVNLTFGLPAVAHRAGHAEPMIVPSQMRDLFLIYGAGVIAVYLVLTALYGHAYRRRVALELNELESFDTRWSILGHALAASIGALSVFVALLVPPQAAGLAGFVYFLFGPVLGIHGWLGGKRHAAIEARLQTAEPA